MAINLNPSVSSLPSLSRGSTDSTSVKILQQALVAAGYMSQADMNTGAGIYGPKTEAAVKAWQMAFPQIDAGADAGSFGPKSKAFLTNSSISGSTNTSTPSTTTPVTSAPTTSVFQGPAINTTAGAYSSITSTANGANTSPTTTSKTTFNPTGSYNSWADLANALGTTVAALTAANPEISANVFSSNSRGSIDLGWLATKPTGWKSLVVPSGSTNVAPGPLFQSTAETSVAPSQKASSVTSTSNPNQNVPLGVSSHYPRNTYGATEASPYVGRNVLTEKNISEEVALEGVVDKNIIAQIQNNPELVAFYVHAVTYGGYTWEDVVRDMKREELFSKGNQAAGTLQIISADMIKTDYYNSTEGKTAASVASSIIPNVNVGGLANMNILQYGLNMPDESFKKIVPMADTNSQEYKDAVAAVKSMYFDLNQATLDAQTKAEVAFANSQMDEFKKQVNEKYGLALADDAGKAWGQLQSLETSFGIRGLSGSGMQEESVDQTLAQTRRADQIKRGEKLTEEENKKASMMRSTGTDAQIGTLSAEERNKYGLAVPPEIAAKFNFATLKAKYPDETDAQIQQRINAIMFQTPDGGYAYHSTLYQKYWTDTMANTATQNASAKTKIDTMQQNTINDTLSAFDRSQPFSNTLPTQKSTSSQYSNDPNVEMPQYGNVGGNTQNQGVPSVTSTAGTSVGPAWTASLQQQAGVQLPDPNVSKALTSTTIKQPTAIDYTYHDASVDAYNARIAKARAGIT